jgi:hypothetical protein
VPPDRCGDVELRGDGLGHWAQEVLESHVEEWRALRVVVGDGVEADVDAAAGIGDRARCSTAARSRASRRAT